MSALGNLLNIVLPKKRNRPGGQANTPTHNPRNPSQVLTIPQYQDHLTDLFDSRHADDSRDLMQQLFQNDPDVSATVNSYLTLANTQMSVIVRDLEGEIDREATRDLMKALQVLTRPTDYSLGFQLKSSLDTLCEEMRYLLLLRGSIGAELIFDKQMVPSQIRHVDMASIRWYEQKPGEYKPRQEVQGERDGIDLNVPTFFTAFFRRDPTAIYTKSFFVAAINTIAARQQVINDLYRIMRRTGYPRITVKVLEEVLMKNLPPALATDERGKNQWVQARINEITTSVQNTQVDDAFVHLDSVEPNILNDKNPGVAVDITHVVEVLNAQNQAGLKTMATVIGRGTQGVNTGSVEARIAAMNADQINGPIAKILTDIFSFILHFNGYQGFVDVQFAKVELRPELELEAQKNLKAARLRNDLSDGLITDDEYHLQMYGRLRPEQSPELSGTGFNSGPAGNVDADRISPNGDPLGRSLTSEGADQTRSNSNRQNSGDRNE